MTSLENSLRATYLMPDCGVQVAEEQVGRRGVAVHPLRPVLHRTLADVQERLTFRAQAFIKVIVTVHPLSTPTVVYHHMVDRQLPCSCVQYRNGNLLLAWGNAAQDLVQLQACLDTHFLMTER